MLEVKVSFTVLVYGTDIDPEDYLIDLKRDIEKFLEAEIITVSCDVADLKVNGFIETPK